MPALKYLRPHRCTRGWNQITHQCYHGYRYCTEQCINEIKSQKVTSIQLVIFWGFFLPWSLHLIVRSWKRTCSMKHKSEYNIYSAISLFVINELFIVRFFKTNFWRRNLHEGILLDDMEAWAFSRSYACVMFSQAVSAFCLKHMNMFSVEISYSKNK